MTRKNEIRCIALDLDGTTLNSKGQLSERNRKAIERALEHHIQVIIASGRPLASLPEEVARIPGIRYAVTSNGAAVCDLDSGKTLKEYQLTGKSVEEILALTSGMDVAYEVLKGGIPYAESSYVEDPVRYGASAMAVPYIQRTRRPVEDIQGFIRAHRDELDCMDVVIREGKEELWKRIESEVADVYVTSSVPQLLEISYKEAGKAAAVGFLLDRLDLGWQNLAAFGDGDNDRELLKAAGIGIAVANAVPGCRKDADKVTCSNDEDGVGIELERMLFI